MKNAFKTLIEAAVLAPSGDNTQPWRFDCSEEDASLAIWVDESRDTSPMNADQRMARHACGAALENIVRTAEHNGWTVEVTLHNEPLMIATVYLRPEDLDATGEIERAIKNRHTNRKLYSPEKRISPPDVLLSQLEAEHVSLEWITDHAAIDQWAQVIGLMDALMFRQPGVLRAFLANVRFDRPATETVEEGLSVGSLEVDRVQATILPYFRSLPEWVTTSTLVTKPLGAHSAELVESSSGLCLIKSRSTGFEDEVRVGAVFERVWLALADVEVAVQPMMSWPVLRLISEKIGLSQKASRAFDAISSAWVPDALTDGMMAAVLRFGYSDETESRTGRLRNDAAGS